MTERKPPGVSFESWIDTQIREGMERGEFDNLPGAGKPIPDLGDAHDELWWVKQKLRRENVSFLPPSLVLRKEAEDALAAAARARSEAEARGIVEGVNDKIREAIRMPPSGPALNLMPFEVERVIEEWRADRRAVDQPAPAPTAEGTATAPTSGRRTAWWRRRASRRSRPT